MSRHEATTDMIERRVSRRIQESVSDAARQAIRDSYHRGYRSCLMRLDKVKAWLTDQNLDVEKLAKWVDLEIADGEEVLAQFEGKREEFTIDGDL